MKVYLLVIIFPESVYRIYALWRAQNKENLTMRKVKASDKISIILHVLLVGLHLVEDG
jgi:hypothetical protein